MADLLVDAPSIPSLRLKSILHRQDTKSQRLKHSKSSPQLVRDRSAPGAVSRAFQGVHDYWLGWRDGLSTEEREERRLRAERRQILCLRMKNAETHQSWEAAAKKLDTLEGNDEWKMDDTTGDYNPALIAERLGGFEEARSECDLRSMMYRIRTSLNRDLGGMNNVDLYRHSYLGTKHLIERYVDSTLSTIDAIVAQSSWDTNLESRDLLEGMIFARQSFGRSALLLSGGGTFGMAHVGVLKTLHEAKLLPRIISGASAGSIVCAVLCTRTEEEIPDLIKDFAYGDLAVFDEETGAAGVLANLRRLLTEGSWSDIKHLTRVMRELTGDLTFQEAYNRTRSILNICVSTSSVYELPRLLNYVTAPNVMIWSAVAASCSVPLFFNASALLVKDPVTGEHLPWNPTPERWIDGSVDNDLPMTRLSEMFNVNHFIVSQVNPHVVPFLGKDDHLSPEHKPDRPKIAHDEFDWVSAFTTMAKDEMLHRLQFLTELGIAPNLMTKFRSILSQKYSGDITILPEMNLNDMPRLLSNPTTDFMLRSSLAGQRATWPKLSRIRDRCATELALDRAVHKLRTRVVFSESQQDLRKLHASAGNLRFPGRHSAQPSINGPVLGVRRHRRQSGGSLVSAADRRRLLEAVAGTPEGEPGEKMLEMRTRRAHSPSATRKPILKRSSHSHVQMPSMRRSFLVPIQGSPALDQSQPASQVRHTQEESNTSDLSSWFPSQPWSDTKTSSRSKIRVSPARGHGKPYDDEYSSDSDMQMCEDRSRTSLETQTIRTDEDLGLSTSVPTDESEGLDD